MQTITESELIEKISKINSTFVGLETLTDARALKTGNPYGKIFKKTRSVAHIGANYEESVNREAERQGEKPEFQAEPLPYGEWKVANKIIEHKGEFQLRTHLTPRKRKQSPKVEFFAENGAKLTYDEVKPYLPEKRESNKQQEETGIQKTVWVRNYAFKSIKRIRINGTTYNLVKI